MYYQVHKNNVFKHAVVKYICNQNVWKIICIIYYIYLFVLFAKKLSIKISAF